MVAPRRQGVEYDVEVAANRLLIVHNDGGAENFELATAPLPGTGDSRTWTPLIPYQADTRLLGVDAFASHTVVYFRRGGLTGLRVLAADGESREIQFPEPVYTVSPGSNPEYTQTTYRLGYNSMVTPGTVYDYDMATGSLTLLKQQPVLPSPAGVAVRERRVRAAPGVGRGARRDAGADLAGVPQGHAARRVRALPAVRVRQLRALHRPDVLDLPAVAARPRLRLRDRARPRRRRDWAARGTSTGRCWRRRTRSPTSWPAPRTWSPRAGRRRPGWSPAAARPAAC